MNIGTTIKNARRKLNMTQEQLAEYLNVSISAVSQWESDKTSPDITIIPSICNLLDISADELLGVDILKKQEKIDAIDKKAMEYTVVGKNEEAIKILRQGLVEFPNSYHLMALLSSELWSNRQIEGNLDEAIALGEKILNECTDEEDRQSAIQILCFSYPEEKAAKLAEKMPHIAMTSQALLSRVYKQGDKRFEKRKDFAVSLISMAISEIHTINTKLDDGSWAYTIDEEISICKKALSLIDVLFENGDYGEFIINVIQIYYQITRLYCKKGDTANALGYFERTVREAIAFDTEYDKHKKHTSLLFRNDAYDGFGFSDTHNESFDMVENVDKQNEFDIIRDTDKFKELYAKLKEVASENRDFERYKPI